MHMKIPGNPNFIIFPNGEIRNAKGALSGLKESLALIKAPLLPLSQERGCTYVKVISLDIKLKIPGLQKYIDIPTDSKPSRRSMKRLGRNYSSVALKSSASSLMFRITLRNLD